MIRINACRSQLAHAANSQETKKDAAMKAQDVMTADVVTARPEMSVKDIAALMATKHISGLPVISKDGDVVGMVSESDLLRRTEIGTAESETALSRLLSLSVEQAKVFAKAHGKNVRNVMSRPVISVDKDSELGHVADVLDRNSIKRVPVVEGKKLVGIIARADLVRALSQADIRRADVSLGSGIIQQALRDAMSELPWLNTSYVNSSARNGLVRLWGYVETEAHRDALRVIAEEIPGVERVEAELTVGVPQLNWDGTIVEQ